METEIRRIRKLSRKELLELTGISEEQAQFVYYSDSRKELHIEYIENVENKKIVKDDDDIVK